MYMYCTSLITLPDHVIRVSSCIYKAVGHAFAPNVVCWSLYFSQIDVVTWCFHSFVMSMGRQYETIYTRRTVLRDIQLYVGVVSCNVSFNRVD